MKYDFSNIPDEVIKYAQERYTEESSFCAGIDCGWHGCPFSGNCFEDNTEIREEEFKKEFRRREKMENKMPELKAGMIVELKDEDCLFIVLPDTNESAINGLNLFDKEGFNRNLSAYKSDISKIYTKPSLKNYSVFFLGEHDQTKRTLDLIWSKKSEEDIKIEKLEKTIKDAQEQIQEIKKDRERG